MALKLESGILIIAIIAVLFLGVFLQKNYDLFVVTGSETMTRSLPSTVNPSSTFTLTYTALGTSGTWGASIVDNVAGGCKFPDGTAQLKTVMLSPDGNTKTVTITAPASGSCTFTGDYQYGNFSVKNFPSQTITICQPTCTRPADLCLSSSSDGCGGTCTWTVTKNTPADTNCNNIVDRTELGTYINSWIAGSVTRDALGTAIMAWVGS